MAPGTNIRIKVCGMREGTNILDVASFSPDYMGFIFFPVSPRYVGENLSIPEEFPVHISRVGVFVNETTEEILKKSRKYGFNLVQLHGNESVQQVSELKDAGLKVMKVFAIGDSFDFYLTKPFVPVTDFFLFDTKGKYHGGNAKPFDWEILKHYDQEVPFFLSGGLSPENVREITSLEGMNLHALDVNSGIEDAPGVKSLTKLSDFVDSVGKLRFNGTI